MDIKNLNQEKLGDIPIPILSLGRLASLILMTIHHKSIYFQTVEVETYCMMFQRPSSYQSLLFHGSKLQNHVISRQEYIII